jgi:hypothetical protein
MIFPMGSIFIVGSWVYKTDNKGNLQGHLIEALEACEGLTLPMRPTEDLVERLSGLTVFETTRALTTTSLDLTSGLDSPSESYLGSFKDKPSPFSNWPPEHDINPSKHQFEPTSGFYRKIESPPNWT